MFDNLLINAIQHNPPGRTVTITASAAKPEALSLQSTIAECSPHQAEMLYCTVTDDGSGMSQDRCDRLFKPYVRSLDNPHCTGIGLGLHRCQQIIEAHGGQIGVNSQPGAGTTIWFTLPLSH